MMFAYPSLLPRLVGAWTPEEPQESSGSRTRVISVARDGHYDGKRLASGAHAERQAPRLPQDPGLPHDALVRCRPGDR